MGQQQYGCHQVQYGCQQQGCASVSELQRYTLAMSDCMPLRTTAARLFAVCARSPLCWQGLCARHPLQQQPAVLVIVGDAQVVSSCSWGCWCLFAHLVAGHLVCWQQTHYGQLHGVRAAAAGQLCLTTRTFFGLGANCMCFRNTTVPRWQQAATACVELVSQLCAQNILPALARACALVRYCTAHSVGCARRKTLTDMVTGAGCVMSCCSHTAPGCRCGLV